MQGQAELLNVKRAIAARIECAHRRASAGSADNIQLDARGLEYFENPNVRKATIAAATECDTDGERTPIPLTRIGQA